MTSPSVVGAKLARPKLPAVLLRARLVEQLIEGVPAHPLTVLVAGPGYGKTTLLASFAERYPHGVVWYSLGREDADLAIFLSHVMTGLRRQTIKLGTAVRSLLEQGGVTPTSAASYAGAFLNDVHRVRQPLTVVLDDFHLVSEDGQVVEFLSRVLEGARSGLRFMIASRSEPPLALSLLRARRQILELGPKDLAFTREELAEIVEMAHERRPTEEALDLLALSTEGWIAAVQLLLAANPDHLGADLSSRLRRASYPGSSLHAYLADEVLSRQPHELRDWMIRTAALDEIDPRYLPAILGEGPHDDRIQALLDRRLLIPFEGDDGTIYRYHALLVDFLRQRLRAELSASERESFLVKAAEHFVERGDLVSAAGQLAQCDNPSLLSSFLRDHALSLLDQGHYQALQTWFGSLPQKLFDTEPWLRLRLGDVRHQLGDLPGSELDYERARERFLASGDERGLVWAFIGLGRIWNLRGQAERAAEEGREALARADAMHARGEAVDPEMLIRLLQVVSGARFYLGHYGAALEMLDRMEALCHGKPERQAAIWNNRAVVRASQGNFSEAAQAFERSLERPGVRTTPRAALHLQNLALLLDEMGDGERAQSLLREAIDLARTYQNRTHLLWCLIGQARLAYRAGDIDRSLALLRDVEGINADLKVAMIEADSFALRARILGDRGQHAAARTAIFGALAAYGAASRDANWLLYRIEAAVVELRADRVPEARRALAELHPLALELEALFPRTMLLFFLGEAERRLGNPAALDRLAEALGLAESLGYDSALRAEMRRTPDTFLYLLEQGRCPAYIARIAVGLGSSAERSLLPYVGREDLPEASAIAILDAIAEIGGPASHDTLAASGWIRSETYAKRARNALRDIERRTPELASPRGSEEVHLRIETLGGLTVYGPQGEIPKAVWKSRRALDILVYLAVRRTRGISKERLMELFWPGQSLERVEKNFHPTISYIRSTVKQLLDVPAIAIDSGLYSIPPDLKISIDSHQFEAILSRARGQKDARKRLKLLEGAIDMYRGDFLGDLVEPWAEDVRTELASQFESALEEAANLHLAAKEVAEALQLYRRLLERDPYREEIHAKVMLCYHRLGDRRALREQYQRLETLLRQELQVEPLPETRSLYQSLTVGL